MKAGLLTADRPYFAAKLNANFPKNGRHGLPTIQGAVLLSDATTVAACDHGFNLSHSPAYRCSKRGGGKVSRPKGLEDGGGLWLRWPGQTAQIQALLALCTAETVTVYDIDGDKARRFRRR